MSENITLDINNRFARNDLREEIASLRAERIQDARTSRSSFWAHKRASGLAIEIFSKELRLKQLEFGKFKDVDTVIVVPGAGSEDGRSSEDGKSSEQSIERCVAAYKKYYQLRNEGKKVGIIFSGGSTSGPGSKPEASIMFEELRTQHEESPIPLVNMDVRLGIENLTTESRSMDTSENAQYSAEIIESIGEQLKDVFIITNGYHTRTVNQYFQRYLKDSGKNVRTLSVEDILLQEDGNEIYDIERLEEIKYRALSSNEERSRNYRKIEMIFNNLPVVVRQMVTYYMRGR